MFFISKKKFLTKIIFKQLMIINIKKKIKNNHILSY